MRPVAWLRWLCLTAVILAATSCGGAATPTVAVSSDGGAVGATYKIGFLASVTGTAATLGEPERNVAVMLQQQLDAAGGVVGPDGVRHPVQIIIQDTQGSADTAVSLVQEAHRRRGRGRPDRPEHQPGVPWP